MVPDCTGVGKNKALICYSKLSAALFVVLHTCSAVIDRSATEYQISTYRHIPDLG